MVLVLFKVSGVFISYVLHCVWYGNTVYFVQARITLPSIADCYDKSTLDQFGEFLESEYEKSEIGVVPYVFFHFGQRNSVGCMVCAAGRDVSHGLDIVSQ